MVTKNKNLTRDFEGYKIKTGSEIEELTISVTNLEKRNVELKLQLRTNTKTNTTTVTVNQAPELSIQAPPVIEAAPDQSDLVI